MRTKACVRFSTSNQICSTSVVSVETGEADTQLSCHIISLWETETLCLVKYTQTHTLSEWHGTVSTGMPDDHKERQEKIQKGTIAGPIPSYNLLLYNYTCMGW